MRSSSGSSLKLRSSPNASSCRAVRGKPNSSQTMDSHRRKYPSSIQKTTSCSTSPRSPSSSGFRCSNKSQVGTSGSKCHRPSRHAGLVGLIGFDGRCFFFLDMSHASRQIPQDDHSLSLRTWTLQPFFWHPRQVQGPLAGHPLGGVFVHVRLAVLGPLEEVGDHPEASLQQFKFPSVRAAEINPSLLSENGRVCFRTSDLEAKLLCLLQVVCADRLAIPEVKGRVLKVVGHGLVIALLQEEAGLPVVTEPQALGLSLLAQDHGEPGTAFPWLALDLDGFIAA